MTLTLFSHFHCSPKIHLPARSQILFNSCNNSSILRAVLTCLNVSGAQKVFKSRKTSLSISRSVEPGLLFILSKMNMDAISVKYAEISVCQSTYLSHMCSISIVMTNVLKFIEEPLLNLWESMI